MDIYSKINFTVGCGENSQDQKINKMRKCRNWQTSKTKDLVTFVSCGFKSHLPHQLRSLEFSRLL